MKKYLIITLILAGIIYACKSSYNKDATKKLAIAFESKSNSTVTGNAVFEEKNGIVTFTANLSGLTPGIHAIHIHEKADCSVDDASSAGGHWNPTFTRHGKWGIGEHHKGDIGNFTADIGGKGTIKLATTEWCIGCGDLSKDVLGKSLIVHLDSDDYTTQPTGNAGGRVACSAIIK